MQLNYIMTVTGPFDPNALIQLAAITRQFDAQWLNTQVIRIEQQFTAMMKVAVDPLHDADMKLKLMDEFPQFTFLYDGFIPEETQQCHELTLSLSCPDRSGLTQEIHRIFSTLKIDIIQQQSLREQDKQDHYRAYYRLSLPKQVQQADLLSHLRQLDPHIRLLID